VLTSRGESGTILTVYRKNTIVKAESAERSGYFFAASARFLYTGKRGGGIFISVDKPTL
jgi:hypothetical protein